ncbi:unnamed protein product [Vicia faba]|uniref:No apical meristem-associated C-terminal domain-containing protein n=1 Tax=Vicia faba TaxID=3906 RepID=A0AAV0YYW2_VICFA|nr:unnamed protein product [Vicia faba]
MPSSNPNYRPYYGSMMSYSSQAPPYYSSTPMGNENVPNIGLDEFPDFSTQTTLGGMSGGYGATPNAKDSTYVRRKSPKWTTDQNLVLISGWIKYGTDSVVGNNQKSDSYWGKIAYYCNNEHCSFDPPRDGAACRNHYNYMNKILNKWTDAYDNAKCMQKREWSENDVLAKAHELYSSGKSGHFILISEWLALRDQPRYGSQVGGNSGSVGRGSKRARESDASDSNSVESSVRPMGRDTTKKRVKKSNGAALESINKEWNKFKQFKEKELERLDKIAMRQEEANQLLKESTEAKKMKMFMKLSSKEHLDDRSKELLEKLSRDLFGN